MLEALIGVLGRFLVGFLIEWLRDRRRERDLKRLGWKEADLRNLREVNDAYAHMASVHHRPARERLREGSF